MKHFIFILAALLFTCSAANAQGLTDARKQVKDITRSAGEDSLSYKLNSKWYSVHIGQQDTLRIISDDTVVVDITAAALNAVSLGSLRVAIELIAAIPADQLDGHFLTEARLTAKRNEIEVFLGITKSKAYNE